MLKKRLKDVGGCLAGSNRLTPHWHGKRVEVVESHYQVHYHRIKIRYTHDSEPDYPVTHWVDGSEVYYE